MSATDPLSGEPVKPVGHAGARVEISERPAWAISGWFGVLVVLICIGICMPAACGTAPTMPASIWGKPPLAAAATMSPAPIGIDGIPGIAIAPGMPGIIGTPGIIGMPGILGMAPKFSPAGIMGAAGASPGDRILRNCCSAA